MLASYLPSATRRLEASSALISQRRAPNQCCCSLELAFVLSWHGGRWVARGAVARGRRGARSRVNADPDACGVRSPPTSRRRVAVSSHLYGKFSCKKNLSLQAKTRRSRHLTPDTLSFRADERIPSLPGQTATLDTVQISHVRSDFNFAGRHRRLSLLFSCSEKEPTEKRGSRHGEQRRAQNTAAERGCCRVFRACGTLHVASDASRALWLVNVRLTGARRGGAARLAVEYGPGRDQTAAGDRYPWHKGAAGSDGRLIGHAGAVRAAAKFASHHLHAAAARRHGRTGIVGAGRVNCDSVPSAGTACACGGGR